MIDNSNEFLVANISKQDIIDSFKNSPYGCVPDIVKKKLDVVTFKEIYNRVLGIFFYTMIRLVHYILIVRKLIWQKT